MDLVRQNLADAAGLIALRFNTELVLVESTARARELLGPELLTRGTSLQAIEKSGALYPSVTADAQSVRAGLAATEKRVSLDRDRSLLVRICHDPAVVGNENGVVISLTDVSAFFRHHDGLARTLAEIADYKHALDRSSILSMTDREGRIIQVNDLFCQTTGYRRDELLGKNHRIVNSGYHPKSFMKQLWETILAGEVWSGTIRNRAKSGTYHWVYTTIVPFMGDDGRPSRFLAIRNTVSDPEATPLPLRGPARTYRWFDESPVGVALTDDSGQILETNKALLKLLDRPESQVVGCNVTAFSATDDDPREAMAHVSSGRRESVAEERQLSLPGGRLQWARVTTWRMPQSETQPASLIHMFEDTSDLREAALQLRNTSQLAKLGEMAAVVAHEVKNPLAGIGGALHIIADRLPETSSERMILGEIQARLQQLNELVNGLSRYARPVLIQHPMQVNLAGLIGQVASRLRQQDRTAPITCEEHGDCTIDGDMNLLTEMFSHVLDNACRVNRGERGPVAVSITTALHVCTIKVCDHGPGLSPDVQARIFDPFFTTKNQGVGLGLAQARRIALAHGGEIRVAHSDANGTVVEVELPRQRRSLHPQSS